MRIHRLTVTAFGPFPGTETVDFDELNAAGIFLLTGPTGAGKTSLLDALCFALYGVVPGDRGVKTLRSHHAPDGIAPAVRLDFSLANRRFVVERSPEWSRPKKRGEGETREHARASLFEVSEGDERLISSRAAEVGHQLGQLLGISSDQFMQVVLLPQGKFQRFLRATSDERKVVLEQLFGTQRFTRVEAWVHDHSKKLAEAALDGEADVRRLVDTLAHRAQADLPDTLQGTALSRGALDTALPWASDLVEAAQAVEAELLTARDAAAERCAAAQEAVHAATMLLTAQQRRLDALAVLEHLDATADEAADMRAALDAQDKAATVVPVLQLTDNSRRALTAAEAQTGRALDELALLPEHSRPAQTDATGCRDQRAVITARTTSLREVLALDQRRQQHAAAADHSKTALADSRRTLEELRARAAALPQRREQAAQLLEQSAVAAALVDSTTIERDRCRARLEAATAVPSARRIHADAHALALDLREIAVTARSHHLDIVERRLRGMAAELAGQLQDGVPCQVCGSHEHPRPAIAGHDAASETEQRDAAEEAIAAQREADRAGEAEAEARRSLERWEEISGGLSVDAAREALIAADAELVRATDAVGHAEGLRAELAHIEEERGRLDVEIGDARAQCDKWEADLEAHTQALGALRHEMDALLDSVGLGPPHATAIDVDRHLDDCERAMLALTAAIDALDHEQHARHAHDDATSHATRSAAAVGFMDLDAVRAAVLPADQVDLLRDRLREREARTQVALAALADPAVIAAEHSPTPDLDQLRRDAEQAMSNSDLAGSRLGVAAECAAALATLREELRTALHRWAPLHEKHLVAESMAKLVNGRGSDNQLQMRLSSYVLATRLDQVLDAANERLAHMRDQRYELRRTGKASRKGSQAGLGVELLDSWTGDTRDPSTLSGGETFVVSLALALGLADVVMHESGGLRVDTLFVDEGFGMLDPDTLDDVMDRIDELRAGGRSVGVVSHVTELRSRILTQVHVAKGRDGSRVAVRTLVA